MTEVTRAEFEQLRNSHEQLQQSHIETRERIAQQEAVVRGLEGDVREIGRKVDTLTAAMQSLKSGIDEQFAALNSGRSKLVLGSAGCASGVAAATYWVCTNVPAFIAVLAHTVGVH